MVRARSWGQKVPDSQLILSCLVQSELRLETEKQSETMTSQVRSRESSHLAGILAEIPLARKINALCLLSLFLYIYMYVYTHMYIYI